jgi:hypothetical protein
LTDILPIEYEDTTFLRIVGNQSLNDTAAFTRRPMSFLNLVCRHKVGFLRGQFGPPYSLDLHFITHRHAFTLKFGSETRITAVPRRSSRHSYRPFFSRRPKCSIYLGRGTKFYALKNY